MCNLKDYIPPIHNSSFKINDNLKGRIQQILIILKQQINA